MATEKPSFDSLDLLPALAEVVKELGFTEPTEIQARAIPLLMEGRDLIGQSKTGSGKTLAFTLPILQNLGQERVVLGLEPHDVGLEISHPLTQTSVLSRELGDDPGVGAVHVANEGLRHCVSSAMCLDAPL